MDIDIKAKAKEIRQALRRMAETIRSGDDAKLLHWVIDGELACAHRPLRHHPEFGSRGKPLPAKATGLVYQWADRVKDSGNKSIICLMHPKELRHYDDLGLGSPDLIEFYRDQGFEVEHIPWDDPAHRLSLDEVTFQDELQRVRDEALNSFESLPKPVLIHCSAGIDRSAPVAAFIFHARHDAG